MPSLNVSLPKTLREYVENQVEEGGYSTPSEYVRSLIREDQKKRVAEKIEALLMEGIRSGEPIRADDRFWDQRHSVLKSSERKRRR